MEKFVEYKKMSKKKQKEYNNAIRGSFGSQPYTLAHKSAKDYDRKTEKLKIRKELERAGRDSGSFLLPKIG